MVQMRGVRARVARVPVCSSRSCARRHATWGRDAGTPLYHAHHAHHAHHHTPRGGARSRGHGDTRTHATTMLHTRTLSLLHTQSHSLMWHGLMCGWCTYRSRGCPHRQGTLPMVPCAPSRRAGAQRHSAALPAHARTHPHVTLHPHPAHPCGPSVLPPAAAQLPPSFPQASPKLPPPCHNTQPQRSPAAVAVFSVSQWCQWCHWAIVPLAPCGGVAPSTWQAATTNAAADTNATQQLCPVDPRPTVSVGS